MLLTKYSIVYVYLLLVMGVSYALGRHFRNNELSRNMVHVCAGLGWIWYRILFPATIHPIIISFSFVLLTVATRMLKIRFIERESDSLGTVYFTSGILAMSCMGYGNPLLFDIFGVAIFCLSCGDAAANIVGSRYGTREIYRGKSAQGTAACLCASFLGMFLLRCLFGIGLSFAAICLLSMLCAITEFLSGGYDNIAIPAVIYAAAYMMLASGDAMRLVSCIAAGVFMFGFALKLKFLDLPASYMLFCLVSALFYFGGFKSYLSLMLLFSVVIVSEKCLRKKADEIFLNMNKEHGMRNAGQMMANCLVPAMAVVLYGITQRELFLVAFFAAAAETVGDSTASDIGVFAKSEPVDICSRKEVPKGVSGGISAIGTGSALMVCLYAGLVYAFAYGMEWYHMFVIFVSAAAGIVLDSILGSKIQVLYRCAVCGKLTERECHCQKPTVWVKGCTFFDNTRVNFVCNMFSCGLAGLLMAAR